MRSELLVAGLGVMCRAWHGTRLLRDWPSPSLVCQGDCVYFAEPCPLAAGSPSADLVAVFRTRKSELLEILPGSAN